MKQTQLMNNLIRLDMMSSRQHQLSLDTQRTSYCMQDGSIVGSALKSISKSPPIWHHLAHLACLACLAGLLPEIFIPLFFVRIFM